MADVTPASEPKTERPIVPFLALGDQPHLMGLRCGEWGGTYHRERRGGGPKGGGGGGFGGGEVEGWRPAGGVSDGHPIGAGFPRPLGGGDGRPAG